MTARGVTGVCLCIMEGLCCVTGIYCILYMRLLLNVIHIQRNRFMFRCCPSANRLSGPGAFLFRLARWVFGTTKKKKETIGAIKLYNHRPARWIPAPTWFSFYDTGDPRLCRECDSGLKRECACVCVCVCVCVWSSTVSSCREAGHRLDAVRPGQRDGERDLTKIQGQWQIYTCAILHPHTNE